MDMALRSFVLVAALAVALAAALVGWWAFFGDGLPNTGLFSSRSEEPRTGAITIREGSLPDEFGADAASARRPLGDEFKPEEDRFGRGARGLAPAFGSSQPAAGAAGGFAAATGQQPQFDWSGPAAPAATASLHDLPRSTPDERVEADCRMRGGSDFACRCLVRRAKEVLDEPAYLLLSLAEEPTSRSERLSAATVKLEQLPEISARLAALHTESRRRCGAGLTVQFNRY